MSITFSLPLPLFFGLIPWSIEALCVYLSARVSKTPTGRRSASSLPWETRRAPVASVNRANFLSQSFIGSLCKPRNISLFLSSIFLSSAFFPYLSLNQSPMPFLLRVSLDPAGAGPWHTVMGVDRQPKVGWFTSLFACRIGPIIITHSFLYMPECPVPLLGRALLNKLGTSMFRWYSGKEPACQCRRHKTLGFDPWVGKILWKKKWQPTPSLEDSMNSGVWWATVHGVPKSWTWLSD